MSFDIAIVGAGIGGLSAAIALAKTGQLVTVYESTNTFSEVGAGLQLSPNAMYVLKALGVADECKAIGFEPQSAVMRHFKSGQDYFSVPLAKACIDKYGADYLHIHRADLHSILYQRCIELGVAIQLGHSLKSYSNQTNSVQLKFENSNQFEADLLVGADGIRSTVHKVMLGQSQPQFTGQVAWRGTVATEHLPKGLVKPNANLWVGPGKHFVSYYLRGGELVNFVAVEERDNWRSESWNEEGDISQLREAFAGWHPEVTEILDATGSCFLWALYSRKPLDKWVDKNVALLGDACHPMLPFLAQGAAMAIEDSYVLAKCLSQYSSTEQALQQYQILRLHRATEIQQGAQQNASLYHMSTPVDRAKLAILQGLNKLGLSDRLAANKLDEIYGYKV